MPPPAPRALPTHVRIGFILAGVGVAFTGVSYGWRLFGLGLTQVPSFEAFIQVEILLGFAEYLGLGLGLFFIFLGILRLLPHLPPWSQVGPILILVGVVAVTGVDLAEAILVSQPSVLSLPGWIGYGVLATLVAGNVVTALGVLVSLFAIAKGVLLRGSAAPGLPGP